MALARIALALVGAAAACGAQAHVTIQPPTTAAAGAYAKSVLQVPHGCSGSATKTISVTIPAGFLFAKAQAKPGWTVRYEQAKLPKPVDLHGQAIAQTTSVVRWEGGSLPDDQFDEFTVIGRLSEQANGALPFRVLQICETGQADWGGAAGSEQPAPVLMVSPAQPGAAHAHH